MSQATLRLEKYVLVEVQVVNACNEPQEDKQHILMYPALEAQELWDKSLKALELWLRDKGTDINLREHLMNYLQSWSLANPILS